MQPAVLIKVLAAIDNMELIILKNRRRNVVDGLGAHGDAISEHLYTKGLPDPDLIIRTSGEKRLSGLMPWQSCYSEFYFCKKLWPDFSKKDFDAALKEYARRKRRFGT